jgi:putative restriction endonuclease
VPRQGLPERFAKVGVWSRGDERAPHKPLLILYALGRWARGDKGPVAYADVDRDVRELLREFGPPRQSLHPEYPFWRLQTDGLWTVAADGALEARRGHSDAKKSELLAKNARGSFTTEVQAALAKDPPLAYRIAQAVLDAHFPETYHQELLEAVGLDLREVTRTLRPRDPRFRQLVLNACRHGCAVCGYGVMLGHAAVGVDAAHIRWHTHGGPAAEDNGIALCSLHHVLLDRGAFTLREPDAVVLVSDAARGPELERSLLRHHGQHYRRPSHERQRPRSEHVAWHAAEVFKGQPLP